MNRRITLRLRWGSLGNRLFVQAIRDDEDEKIVAIVNIGEDVDVLLDCCGEAHALDALTTAANQGRTT